MAIMKLHSVMQEIADVIGRESALYLVGLLPTYKPPTKKAAVRTILYVPSVKRLKPDHRLVQILGIDKATALCRAFGGETLQPGNCAGIYRGYRDNAIRSELRRGAKPADLANMYGVSDRHVRNLLREIAHEESRKADNDNRAVTNKPAAA